MPKTRQRGTGVRILSEAKAATADRLLLVAQDESYAYLGTQHELEHTAKWRLRKRRRLKAQMIQALKRYHYAITAAQDVAKKGRHVDV